MKLMHVVASHLKHLKIKLRTASAREENGKLEQILSDFLCSAVITEITFKWSELLWLLSLFGEFGFVLFFSLGTNSMASLVPALLLKAPKSLGMLAESGKCTWPLQLSLHCPACLVCLTQCKLLRVEVTCWCEALSTAGPNPISVSGLSMILTMKVKK